MTALTVLACGGGSLGHVMPALAVAEALKKKRPDCRIEFVCSHRPNERAAVEERGFPVHALTVRVTSKWRAVQWVTLPITFVSACIHALLILRRVRPSIIFSKGSAVSVPVCLAGYFLGIPIVLHESDVSMGRANRMMSRLAVRTCLGFPLTSEAAPPRSTVTGNPTRTIIARGSRDAGRRMTGFSGRRPVLMVMGGSQGSLALNQAVEEHFDALLEMADIIHLTGEGKHTTRTHAHYVSREAAGDDIADLYALADIVVTRAGASALAEVARAGKAAIVIPLTGVARDHQRKNAELLASLHAVMLLPQEDIATLPSVVATLIRDSEKRLALAAALACTLKADAAERIASVICTSMTAL